MFGKIALVACLAFLTLQVTPTEADTSLIYVNVGVQLNLTSSIVSTLNASVAILVHVCQLLQQVTVQAVIQIGIADILSGLIDLLNTLLCRPGISRCHNALIQVAVDINIKLNALLDGIELIIIGVLNLVLNLLDALICLVDALLNGTNTTPCHNLCDSLITQLNNLLNGLLSGLQVNLGLNINLLNAVVVNFLASLP